MTTQELDETRQAWNAIAAGYDAFVTEPSMPMAEEALRRAGIAPGMRVLDVACGSGALALPAARLRAEVLGVDLSPEMIARLQARAAGEGLANLQGRVMDGHALDLHDGSFDIAASQFGVMLFPNLPRALREMARVTRPGGRVLIIVYAQPSELEFLGFFMGAMHAVVPGFSGLPEDPPPLPFQVSDPETLRHRLVAAGLSDVRIERGAEKLALKSGRQFWDWVVNSNPVAQMLIAGLSHEQQTEVQQVLDGMLRERTDGRAPATLTNPTYFAIGTKSGATA